MLVRTMQLILFLVWGQLSLTLGLTVIAKCETSAAPRAQSQTSTSYAAKQSTEPAFPTLTPEEKLQEGVLTARINVPHNTKAVDVFMAYPYPVKPPRIIKPVEKLPLETESLKGMLLQSGYVSRTATEVPYPNFGWRWQYAYRAAVHRSGLSVPHTILTMYPWCDEMIPYVRYEVKKVNAAELERQARYERTVAEFEKSRTEVEVEAIGKGLYPLELKCITSGFAISKVPASTWWVTCTRKVPGLTYYWQIPVIVTPDVTSNLMLTEANALVIQGGW